MANHRPDLTRKSQILRREMTKEERHLWYDCLKSFPVHFYRQKPIGQYIVDFYCPKAKLVIELDGSQHFDEPGLEYDTRRTAILERQGIKILRFSNREIWDNFREVGEKIWLAMNLRMDSK